MVAVEVDDIIARLLPEVLADRELGDGRSFTLLHQHRLWALTCLHAEEYIDEADLAEHVGNHLPPRVFLVREAAAS
jgi:hypothetical protein